MTENNPTTVGDPKDESMYEYFINKEKDFVQDIIHMSDCLKREAFKDPIDHQEIIDLLQRGLSDAFRIRDLAKDKYL